jgi:hypothetical protein
MVIKQSFLYSNSHMPQHVILNKYKSSSTEEPTVFKQNDISLKNLHIIEILKKLPKLAGHFKKV